MSNRISLIENEYAHMWYYPKEGMIHHQLLQPIFGEEFRNLLLTGLRALKKHNADKWLSDDRKNSFLPAEDNAWSHNIWLPQVIKAGWKYWAILPPEKARGQINMQRIMGDVDRYKIAIEVFSDPKEAFKWLIQQGEGSD